MKIYLKETSCFKLNKYLYYHYLPVQVNELKKQKNITILEKKLLYESIENKKDTISTLQKLNKNIAFDSEYYLKSLSTYNLEQLQLFQEI